MRCLEEEVLSDKKGVGEDGKCDNEYEDKTVLPCGIRIPELLADFGACSNLFLLNRLKLADLRSQILGLRELPQKYSCVLKLVHNIDSREGSA